MGYAAHRIATTGLSPLASPDTVATTQHSLTLYTVQLGLNLAWMPLFFVAKRPIAATVDILALIGVNGYMTYLWSSIDEVAAWCQVPYLGWLGFATYLCAGAGYLNNWDLSSARAEPRDTKQ
jgi:benzodiazapine receptor